MDKKILLMEKPIFEAKTDDTRVVLCLFRGEFVTWIRYYEEEDFCGHYHGFNLRAAMKDFDQRVEYCL